MSVFPGTRHFVSFLHPPSGAARRLPAASVLSPPGGHRLSGETDNTTLRRAAFYSARQKKYTLSTSTLPRRQLARSAGV